MEWGEAGGAGAISAAPTPGGGQYWPRPRASARDRNVVAGVEVHAARARSRAPRRRAEADPLALRPASSRRPNRTCIAYRRVNLSAQALAALWFGTFCAGGR